MEKLSRETSERKLPLPVGKSDWEEVAGHCYCVDKTLLIRDLLESRTGVALFTRPRRFGKTTAMQMLKCFFEKRGEGEPDVRHLFESRAIAHCERADEWMAKQGKYPVIYLTFKDHKARTWEAAQYSLRYDIANEFARHKEAAKSLPDEEDAKLFDKIRRARSGGCTMEELAQSLGLLARALHLKPVGGIVSERCLVKIPNHELEHVFTRDILYRLRELSRSSEPENGLENALLDRDVEAFRRYVEQFLLESASYFDASAEGFYHGLVLGMLSFMRDFYVITSNRESGYGRFDIMLKPRPEHREFPAVIIEVKAAKGEADDLDALAAAARRQIDEKNYAASFEAEGITDIMKFGHAFFGKRSAICRVAEDSRKHTI